MKVICTLPNCSSLLYGPSEDPVRFVEHANGMISEDIPEDIAAHFLAVPGFVEAPAPRAKKPASESQDQSGSEADQKPQDQAGEAGDEPEGSLDPEVAALIERAKAVNLTVDGRWKLNRLRSEVEKAEALDHASKG